MRFINIFKGIKKLKSKYKLDKICYLCGRREYAVLIQKNAPVDTIQIDLDLKGE